MVRFPIQLPGRPDRDRLLTGTRNLLIHRRHARVRRHAEALVVEGRFAEAIDLLTNANRVRPHPEIEARLLELRRDGLGAATAATAASWPPHVPDRFSNEANIPEVTRDQLTSELLLSGILHHGCLLVRGLIGPERVHQLVDDIDRAFAAYDAHANGAPVSQTAPWFVRFDPGPDHEIHREWIRGGDGVLAADSPRAFFDVVETFEEIGMRSLLTDYLGEQPLLLAMKTTLRRVEPRGNPDWHQDGAFMGAGIRSVDVWVSLSHCGVDAPGLDLVGRRLDGIIDPGTSGAGFDWSVGASTVSQLAPEGIVQPIFEPGDALLFDHLLLHRTGVHPGMTQDRYAIEAWFAAPSSYPADQLAIAY